MKRKHFIYILYTLILAIFIIIPLLVEYTWEIPSGRGDWLGFWGSYLGIIPSGLIAYFVAKYQIDKDHEFSTEEKNREYLPYFNIKNNAFIFNSMRDNLPIQKATISFYDNSDNLVNGFGKPESLGHLFPGEYIPITRKAEFYSRIDIKCNLINGNEVFFTYGNGVEGAHFVKEQNGKFKAYVLEGNKKSQEIANRRVK